MNVRKHSLYKNTTYLLIIFVVLLQFKQQIISVDKHTNSADMTVLRTGYRADSMSFIGLAVWNTKMSAVYILIVSL